MGHILTIPAKADDILNRIECESGVPGLATILAERLEPSDSTLTPLACLG